MIFCLNTIVQVAVNGKVVVKVSEIIERGVAVITRITARVGIVNTIIVIVGVGLMFVNKIPLFSYMVIISSKSRCGRWHKYCSYSNSIYKNTERSFGNNESYSCSNYKYYSYSWKYFNNGYQRCCYSRSWTNVCK